MARKGRIDVKGAVHHIIQRGVNRSRIFSDDNDRHDFVKRMARNLEGTKTRCFAWALMSNHVHMVLETGNEPIRHVLQCLFTGYAMGYNRKHGRSGHLFQGRYKSILCEKETYLVDLVRYVHLNPLRAGIVNSIKELADYRWTGHRSMMGRNDVQWQKTGEVLKRFGQRIGPARRKYFEFLRVGLKGSVKDLELTGHGLKRLSEGGWESDHETTDASDTYADERILGSREFVERVLRGAGEHERWRSKNSGRWTGARVIERAAKIAGIKAIELHGSGKRPAQCLGRYMACKWMVDDLGKSETEVAGILGITQPAVSICVKRGRLLEKNGGKKLEG